MDTFQLLPHERLPPGDRPDPIRLVAPGRRILVDLQPQLPLLEAVRLAPAGDLCLYVLYDHGEGELEGGPAHDRHRLGRRVGNRELGNTNRVVDLLYLRTPPTVDHSSLAYCQFVDRSTIPLHGNPPEQGT